MKVTINDSKKISVIQKEFTELFPYLKLEFFTKPHRVGGASPKKLMTSSSRTLGECRTIHADGSLVILPKMKVAELEQNFRDMYGLSVQVFRKSGKVWLETTVTDAWTLEQQNKQGEELSIAHADIHQARQLTLLSHKF